MKMYKATKPVIVIWNSIVISDRAQATFAAGLADMPLIARPGLASGLAASLLSLPA
jgi:hypothetical protein